MINKERRRDKLDKKAKYMMKLIRGLGKAKVIGERTQNQKKQILIKRYK